MHPKKQSPFIQKACLALALDLTLSWPIPAAAQLLPKRLGHIFSDRAELL